MDWVTLAILTAINFGLYNVFLKKASELGKALPIAFFIGGLTTLLVAAYGSLRGQLFIPTDNKFWMASLISGSLNSFVAVIYVRGLQQEAVTLSVPLLNLTPVFLIGTAVVIVGESLTPIKIGGIGLVVLGAYLLNLKGGDFLEPFRSVLSSKGSRIFLLIAVLWSITAVFDKLAVLSSNPSTYGVVLFIFITIPIGVVLLLSRNRNNLRTQSGSGDTEQNEKKEKRDRSQHWGKAILFWIMIAAVVNTLMLIFQFTALEIGNVAYVIPIKRAGTLIAVAVGMMLMGEPRSPLRFVAASLMVIGVLVIGFL